MAAILEYGTEAQLDASNKFGSIISNAALNQLLDKLGKSYFTVENTNGSNNVLADGTAAHPALDLLLVEDSQGISDILNRAKPDANGGFENIGVEATTVANNTATPMEIFATDSAFIELTGGPATVYGGHAHHFIVDAEHDSSNLELHASFAEDSYSWVVGGTGSDTLYGASSDTSQAVLTAKSGATTMYGSAGAVTMYGGGNTLEYAGTHSGDMLFGGLVDGAHDTLYAGSGGGDQLTALMGNNTLYDFGGKNDTLTAGSGMDTLYGSQNGSTMFLNQGDTTVISKGSDNIGVAAGDHSDTIVAGSGMDSVTFNGFTDAQVQSLVSAAEKAAAPDAKSITINFGDLGTGSHQTAQLDNFTHIKFSGGSN